MKFVHINSIIVKFSVNHVLLTIATGCGVSTPTTVDTRTTSGIGVDTAVACGIVATSQGAVITCADRQVLIKNGKDGAVGPVGPQGEIGPVGPAGAPGTAGTDGVAGSAGAQGAKGDTGTKGDAGSQGATGSAGTAGAQGQQGSSGPQGEIGPQGETGATGPQGPRGIAGTNGTDGVDGKDGAAGLPGSPGSTITPVIPCPGLSGSFPEVLLCIDNKLYAVFVGTQIRYVQVPTGSYITTDGRSCAFHVTTNCALTY